MKKDQGAENKTTSTTDVIKKTLVALTLLFFLTRSIRPVETDDDNDHQVGEQLTIADLSSRNSLPGRSLFKDGLLNMKPLKIHGINQLLFFSVFPQITLFYQRLSMFIMELELAGKSANWRDIYVFSSNFWIARDGFQFSDSNVIKSDYRMLSARLFASGTNVDSGDLFFNNLASSDSDITKLRQGLTSLSVPKPAEPGSTSFTFPAVANLTFGTKWIRDDISSASFHSNLILHNIHNDAIIQDASLRALSVVKNELDNAFLRSLSLSVSAGFDSSYVVEDLLFNLDFTDDDLFSNLLSDNYPVLRLNQFKSYDHLVDKLANDFPDLPFIEPFSMFEDLLRKIHVFEDSFDTISLYSCIVASQEHLQNNEISYIVGLPIYKSPFRTYESDYPSSRWAHLAKEIDENFYLPAMMTRLVLDYLNILISDSGDRQFPSHMKTLFSNLRLEEEKPEIKEFFPVVVSDQLYTPFPDIGNIWM